MATTTSHSPNVSDFGIDFAARDFWKNDYDTRDREAFAVLRDKAPVAYSRPYESTLQPPEEDTPGFWSVTKLDLVRQVSRDAETFCSGQGILMESFPEVVQVATTSFLAMDDPEHRQLRGIVQDAFGPRNVRKISDWVHQHAVELIDECIEKGEGDFCELVAKRLPGRVFAHFLGLERDSEGQEIIMDAAERMLAWDDPEAAQGRDALTTFAEEAERIQAVAMEMAEKRRENPEDDLVSWVVHAEFEGRQMEEFEIAAFFSLLSSAANDTTRHTTAHAIRLLCQHPDQRDLLMEDLDGRVEQTVEEVLRHATPVMHFRRTATKDTELAGVKIGEGEKVVMWYCSGNRDEDAFPNAAKFDVLRDPKKHLAFGGGGAHFCLGSALGKQMAKSVLMEVYTRMPDIELAGDPVFQQNNFLHGVAQLPVKWTPSDTKSRTSTITVEDTADE